MALQDKYIRRGTPLAGLKQPCSSGSRVRRKRGGCENFRSRICTHGIAGANDTVKGKGEEGCWGAAYRFRERAKKRKGRESVIKPHGNDGGQRKS